MRHHLLLMFTTLWACATLIEICRSELLYTGTNLAGAEFGEGNLPGTYNVHYTYPTAEEVDYFLGQGMNTFRLPFRWERLQRSLNAGFDATELGRLASIVNYATSQGAHVVLDPHNYARYSGGVIGNTVSNAAFADFWTRLADEFKENDKVIFGLMNEPHSMPTEQWFAAAQGAVTAIRATGATNLILVPGNGWTGAHSWLQNWYGTSNAEVMLNLVDPLNHFAFDLHQYLDNDSSGTSAVIVSESIGQERLVAVTNWLRANNRQGFLGEFAVANSTIGAGIGDEAISNMLSYIGENDDVWLGWTWWAGGPWWDEYLFTIEPTNLGQPNQTDRPVLEVLQPFFVPATPPVDLGDFDSDGDVDGHDFLVWQRNPAVGDLTDWQANFGGSPRFTENAQPVPEPSVKLMLVCLIVMSWWGIRNPGMAKFRTSCYPRRNSGD